MTPPGLSIRRLAKRAVLLACSALVWAGCQGGPEKNWGPQPERQSPQPLGQLPLEDPGDVTPVNPEDPCFIHYRASVDGFPRRVRLKLCNIHYHYPADHGRGAPGQWAVPDCPGASNQNYPPPPRWGQKPAPHAHGPHKPTQAPRPGDVVEIHYVYGWEEEGHAAPGCPEIKRAAVASELSDCSQPLVVVAMWAEVSAGARPHPWDMSPFSPFGGTEYSGSTTGAGRPPQKVHWRISAGCREVSINDLDLDGTGAGKIKGHPSRPLQPAR